MNAFMELAEETLRRLGSNGASGLTEEQVAQHREKYGRNAFTREKPPSLAKRILEAVCEPMLLLLLAAAVITLAVNFVRLFAGAETDFFECVGIFVAIGLSVGISVAMEGRSAKAFEALSKMNEDILVKVIRDGQAKLIPQNEIVVGDILCVETGDKLPADARLLECKGLMADESALTGESMPVRKDAEVRFDAEKTPVAERCNMLYSGCFITGGSGKAVVTEVGDRTEFGKIARELSAVENSTTPLQEKMAKLGKRITVLGSVTAGVVFVIQLVQTLLAGNASLVGISEAFISSILLIVAAIPEGLPTIMAVSLALNIIKMSRQNALVKKMIACETVGCVNVICSDKTGTLTENRMTVTDVYEDGTLCKPQDVKEKHLLENFCGNGTANVSFEGEKPSFVGNPTECALITAAHKAGWDYQTVRNEWNVEHVYSFSSETKNMTTVIRTEEGFLAYTKGSPEKILSLCSISDEEREKAEAQITQFQENACRVIGFAHKAMADKVDFEHQRADVECGMTFDGFVAISDPLREDVYDAVTRCRSAGIELKMLTGDNIVTASAIARELGVLDDDHVAVEAKDVIDLSDDELKKRLPYIRVIARSTPVVKMRVVNALKATGNVVAVTGDGINDAPAIKNADVGIAMGISGTEVSKEASDIVLLDDSFATIVKAVQWGRGIYENFQRFIQFQLTVNLSAMLVVLISTLAGFASPFSALELLWINLVMDGPPALTLGLEPIRGDLMKRKPTKRDASIVTGGMLRRIVVNGIFVTAVFFLQRFTNFLGGTAEQQGTILFTLFIVFQMFNAFNSRELGSTSLFRNLLNNRPMLGMMALVFCLQVVITQFGGAVFRTVPLPLILWLKIVAVAFSIVVLAEVIRFFQRLLERRKA